MTSRLRRLRKKHRLNQTELGRLVGTSQQHIARMEKPDFQLPLNWARKIASALEENEDDLIEPRTVPIVGKVGAGAHVYPMDEGGDEDDMPRAACPRGMNAATTKALMVEGDSMYPEIDEGWIVFFDGAQQAVPPDVFGQRCVVQLRDGARLLKRVRRGSAPGVYTLESVNAPPLQDVELLWASRAIALPPDLARPDTADSERDQAA